MNYVPKPLPTLSPSSNLSMANSTFSAFNYGVNRIISFLKAVPVIPHSSGQLFDPSTGEWLTPTVSFFDFMLGLFFVSTLVFILMKLTPVGGGSLSTVAGKVSSNSVSR